jgi:glycogen debranching enzyme
MLQNLRIHPIQTRQARREIYALPDPSLVARALCQLARVESLDQLGQRGPLDASAGRESLFACLFGRDAIRMALDLLDDFPAVGRATILRLTATQGMRDYPLSEEEPGRILHEERAECDPRRAALSGKWAFPYYGSVDATPLYVSLVGAFCWRYGPALLAARVRDRAGASVTVRTGVERALGWIEQRLAPHGDLGVLRAQPHGIQHQVWEDSYDSHHFEDGRLFDPTVPYAPEAVQGYAYDALLVGAAWATDPRRARQLRAQAMLLRRRVLREFWLPECGTFAPALMLEGPAPRPVRVVASSAGHLLASRLLDGPEAAGYREALRRRLAAPDLLAGAGLRTKATGSPRFQPGAYHNGSVWPMDTGLIGDGLRRHGYAAQADDLDERILRACATVGALPEFFRGDPDGSIRVNTHVVDVPADGAMRRVEQPPQWTQGWTASRVWKILRRRGLVPAGGADAVHSTPGDQCFGFHPEAEAEPEAAIFARWHDRQRPPRGAGRKA